MPDDHNTQGDASGGGKEPPKTRIGAGDKDRGDERNVLLLAQEEARRLGHNFVGTEQILIALVRQDSGIAGRVLRQFNIELDAARREVEAIIGRGSGFVAAEPPFTPRAKKVLEFAWEEARDLGDRFIGTEHLLLGLIRGGSGVAVRVLEHLHVNISELRKAILDARK